MRARAATADRREAVQNGTVSPAGCTKELNGDEKVQEGLRPERREEVSEQIAVVIPIMNGHPNTADNMQVPCHDAEVSGDGVLLLRGEMPNGSPGTVAAFAKGQWAHFWFVSAAGTAASKAEPIDAVGGYQLYGPQDIC